MQGDRAIRFRAQQALALNITLHDGRLVDRYALLPIELLKHWGCTANVKQHVVPVDIQSEVGRRCGRYR